MASCQLAVKDLNDIVDCEEGRNAVGLAILIGNDYKGCSNPTFYPLNGPSKDIKKAQQVFSGLGASCFLVENKPAAYTMDVIEAVAARDYPLSYKFIVLIFSGHGVDGDVLIANDGMPFHPKFDLFQPESARLIAKIPKMFFIDACRGNQPTTPITVPTRSEPSLVPRGGKPIASELFPPNCNILIARSTQQRKLAYECDNGGIWIGKVLTRIERDDSSISTILDDVRKDVLESGQQNHSNSIQVSPAVSELIGGFYFKGTPNSNTSTNANGRPPHVQLPQHDTSRVGNNDHHGSTTSHRGCDAVVRNGTQYTTILKQLKKDKRITSKEYLDLPIPGNHVQLSIILQNGVKEEFHSTDYESSYELRSKSQERVAEEAVYFINNGYRKILTAKGTCIHDNSTNGGIETATVSVPAVKDKDWVRTLNEILTNQEKQTVAKENYHVEQIRHTKFKCMFEHPYFSEPFEGELQRSKPAAKQSAAKKALEEYYKLKKIAVNK